MRELVAQSARALLWRGEVTGSAPGYVVLMITNECEIVNISATEADFGPFQKLVNRACTQWQLFLNIFNIN